MACYFTCNVKCSMLHFTKLIDKVPPKVPPKKPQIVPQFGIEKIGGVQMSYAIFRTQK